MTFIENVIYLTPFTPLDFLTGFIPLSMIWIYIPIMRGKLLLKGLRPFKLPLLFKP